MRVLAFLCNWCSYEASLGAGGKRLSEPSDVVFARVMCSGMVQPQAVLEAFAEGADGVMILGCHPGSCHYQEGNYHAINRVALLRRLLEDSGIEPSRLVLDWASATEGDRFAKLLADFRAELDRLGPLPRPATSEGGAR